MSKQDRQGVRTATDLEQKYNFGRSFAEAKKMAESAIKAAEKAQKATDDLQKELTVTDEQGYMSKVSPRFVASMYRIYGEGSYIDPTEICVYSDTFANKITKDKWEIRPDQANKPTDYANYHMMGQVDVENHLVLLYLRSKSGTYPLQVASVAGNNYVRGLSTPVQNDDAATKGYVDNALTEDTDHPGCYYRMVDGVKEWLNPPMLLGEEYRTTERFNGKVVYAKLVDFGSLPNSTSKTATYCSTGATAAVSIKAVLSDGSVLGEGYGRDVRYSNTYGVYIGNTLSNVHITTEADFSGLSAEVLVKYIKD